MKKTAKTVKKCNIKKVKIQKHIPNGDPKTVLIVENMQNCFFTGGSMGFIKKMEEKRLIEYVNKLINLEMLDDVYVNAALSGVMKKGIELEKELGADRKGIKSTGSRKKYFFDLVVFTQTANVPDHWTFASHHYLRNLDYKYFSELNKSRKSYFDCNSKKGKTKCKGNVFLLPDHALTDGSDKFMLNRNEVKGIDFHPDLDTSSLFRPNENLSDEVFINKPDYHNRGFIITKGSVNRGPYSAFKNTLNESTCLADFLKENNVSALYACGIGRENTIKRTLMDSLKYKFIRDRVLLYDATMPILISPLSKKDESAKMVMLENEWTENLQNNGIVVKPVNFYLDLEQAIKTKLDSSQISQGISDIVSVFGNSRSSPKKVEYNNYFEKLEPRKKKKKTKKKKQTKNNTKGNNTKGNNTKGNNTKGNINV